MRPNRTLFFAIATAGLGWFLTTAVPTARSPAADAPQESPRVRYARARLRLAEGNLEQALSINRRLARTITADALDEYQEAVQAAKVGLREALKENGGDQFAEWLRRAAGLLHKAEAQVGRAEAANRKAHDAFDPTEVERLRLRAEVLRASVAYGQAAATPEAQRQWELDFLTQEQEELREQLLRRPASSGASLWWYY
jgi:hypothetical protein